MKPFDVVAEARAIVELEQSYCRLRTADLAKQLGPCAVDQARTALREFERLEGEREER